MTLSASASLLGGGLYFVLGAAGYLPMPENNSPIFIGFCAGAAFLFAGLTCLVRARAGMAARETTCRTARRNGSSPDRVLAIGAAGALATIGTWIAIGSGPRASICRAAGERRPRAN